MRDMQRIVEDTAKKIEDGKPVQGGQTLEGMSPGLPGKIAERWGWDTSAEQVLGLIEHAEETGNPDLVWESLDALAKASVAVYQKAKKRLKDRLGEDLNLNDLERAVSAARKQRRTASQPTTNSATAGLRFRRRARR
jgi:hypothetical protein